jgi:signal transduction histidine kinase
MALWLPNRIIQATLLLCAVIVALTLGIALRQPWLGLELTPLLETQSILIVSAHPAGPSRGLAVPAQLVSVGPVALEPDDKTEEPDMFESYEQTGQFLQRQTVLTDLLRQSGVSLRVRSTTPAAAEIDILVRPTTRPVSDLPASFWVQLITGVGALLIGVFVLALRPADFTARLFALSGAMIALSACTAAIYSSRELAIDGGLFRVLSALNHVGSLGFGMAMIALFLIYPRRMVPLHALWIIPAVFVPWLVADIFRLASTQAIGSQLPTLIEMLLIVVAVLAQWIVNRCDPRARAALTWLGLSVIVGAGAFVSLIIAPILIQSAPAMQQGYAFGFFLLIYAGLSLGVARYRLFDLSEWAFRIGFYTGGTLLLFAIDAALILLLHMQQTTSLGIALLFVGFGYLPLRGALWSRFVANKPLADHEIFRSVIDISLANTAPERSVRWRALLKKLFDPLSIEEHNEPASDVGVRNEGVDLLLPSVADTSALIVRYPWQGRRLFSSAQQDLARELVRLLRYTEESRHAYERGSLEERSRIARDLHDDVGARLLSGLYKNEIGDTHAVLRDAIADIRTIVSGLAAGQPVLGQAIAALRHEAGERLSAAGVDLHWPIAANEDSATLLDYRIYRCFVSAHREVVSNIIRHAQARAVEIHVSERDGLLHTIISDNGIGIDPARAAGSSSGHGLRGLIQRVGGVGGRAMIRPLSAGTIVEITIPLALDLTAVSDTGGLPTRPDTPAFRR